MIKLYLIFFIALSPIFSFAQDEMEIQWKSQRNAQWDVQIGSNHFWGGNLHFVEGRMSIGHGLAINGQIQKKLPFERAVGLSYSFVSTDLTFRPEPFYNGQYNEEKVDMNIHFVNAIATQYLSANEIVQPYFDAGVGIAIYDMVNIENRTHFLMVLGLGSKFELPNRLGLKINGGLKMPLYGGGTGLYCGIGGGYSPDCGLSFNGSVLVTHWELGGALTYSF